MEPLNETSVHPEHTPHHPPGHRHGIAPVDTSYLLVVRTVLWVIAGLVFLGFAIWWIVT
jgi:hypothetical protein